MSVVGSQRGVTRRDARRRRALWRDRPSCTGCEAPRDDNRADADAHVELFRLDFEQLLDAHPNARAAFADSAEASLTANFLKQASPFAPLEPSRLRWLATRLERLTIPAGSTIIRQGEAGDGCYLLRAGRVEVWTKNGEDAERRLAALGPGTLFGEAALLTDAPRNATVRAVEPAKLLLLRRADLLDAIGADRHVGAQMIELVNLRNCPRQVAGITAFQRVDPGGDTITVLKNPRQGTYYQLSLQGSFLWQRLDGRHTVRDLMLDYLGEFKAFAPQVVAEVVGGLMAAGFVESRTLRADVAEAAFRLSPWQRGMLMARRVLEWQVALRDIDTHISRLYHGRGFPVLYTRTGQLVAAGVSLARDPRFHRRKHAGPGRLREHAGRQALAVPDSGVPLRDSRARGGACVHGQVLRL